MSDEIFNFIEKQLKESGMTYFACRPCTTYAQGMNHRVQQIKEEMEEIKKACEKNSSGLQKVQEEVNKLAEKVGKQERIAVGALDETSVYDELREREQRKANVIMYGMPEAPSSHVGRQRYDWDLSSCKNLFRALKLNMTETSIRFVRRVGEAGAHPRPLVVGFHEEQDRRKLLRSDTRSTAFSNVELGPDLTKKQRQEEANLRKEAVKRNQAMTTEDCAKNLAWQVMGPRGEKRLEKRYVDYDTEMARGRRTHQRQRTQPGGAQRGRVVTQQARGSSHLSGANSLPLGEKTTPQRREIEEEEEDMETEGESEEGTEGEEEVEEVGEAVPAAREAPKKTAAKGRGRGRPRLNKPEAIRQRIDSKRKEREGTEEEEMMPPAKH